VSSPQVRARHGDPPSKVTKIASGNDSFVKSESEEGCDHECEKFDNIIGQLRDPEIKGFAEKTLPVLKGHLERIEGIAKQQ